MGDDTPLTSEYNSRNFAKGESMKQYRILLALGVLVLASLACQAVTGGREEDTPPATDSVVVPTQAPSENGGTGGGGGTTTESDFPMTPDAYNVTDIGDGSLLFYTKLSAEEAMDFYRQEYTAMGYTERELLTVVSDGVFSMVFDGDPSGQAVVIQSVDLGDGSRTIAIRLEDV
jgi:hypothetical protein